VDDIPHFVEHCSRRFAARDQRPLWKPTSETLRRFCEYHWPGNIRQLANVIEQAYVLDCEPQLPDRSSNTRLTDAALPFTDLSRLRRVAVRQALRATQGHKGRAAQLLGVHPNTMTRLLAQLRQEEANESPADGDT
jgi:DNA-binding NtrC family response regulator